MNDRATLQGVYFNMRGQLYRGRATATALFGSPVVSALGSESDDPGSSPGRGKVLLCPWDVREKKKASSTFRLGKNLYISVYTSMLVINPQSTVYNAGKYTMQNSAEWCVSVRGSCG